MMIRGLLLSILVCCFGQICQANGPVDGGCKGKKCQNSAPDATEGFLFVAAVPAPVCRSSVQQDQKELELFYRWYLRNEEKIRANASREKQGLRDLVPPLDISWNTVEHYAAYIRKSDPALDTIRQSLSLPQAIPTAEGSNRTNPTQPGTQTAFSLKK